MDSKRNWVTSVQINPTSHTNANVYLLTSKAKRKCLRFFRAKPQLLNYLSMDVELWELLVAELNESERQKLTEAEYSNAVEKWKCFIILDGSSLTNEDEQLRQILYRMNEATMVEPTTDQLKCILQCVKIHLLEKSSLWSRIAARLNILCNKRYSVRMWQQTFKQFTKQLVEKKSLSNYLTTKYGKSPVSLTKIEQRFLNATIDRDAPNKNESSLSICRICLAVDSPEMIYLFEYGSNSTEASLVDKLLVCGCFDVEPQIDDNLPQFICKCCSLLIESAYQLRMLCTQNEQRLREIASQRSQSMNGLFRFENCEDKMEIDVDEEPIVVTLSIKNDDRTENGSKKLPRENENSITSEKLVDNYLCEQCGRAFLRKSSLRHHLIAHGVMRSHVCEICNKAFKQWSSWRNHQAVHNKTKDFKCTECAFTTNTISNLRVHQRTHSDIQAYPCKYCEMKFKTASNQLKHMRGVHEKQRSFQCHQCECTYFTRESLRRHTITHTGQRPFFCAVKSCSQNYLWYSGLRKHMQQFHTEDKVKIPSEKYYLDKFFESLPPIVIEND